MKPITNFIFVAIFFNLFLIFNLIGLDGGRVDGSMAREGMGFHQYHGGYHRSHGGYGYGRAYGAYGRHFGRYGHRGYDRYGSQGYMRQEANPADNVVTQPNGMRMRKRVAIEHRDFDNAANAYSPAAAMRAARAIENEPRGEKYWGYYSPYYQYGLYPWYNYGDPFYYYQKADYYPWYYGYNPGWLWW